MRNSIRKGTDKLLAFFPIKQYICDNDWSGSPTDSIPIIQLIDMHLSISIAHWIRSFPLEQGLGPYQRASETKIECQMIRLFPLKQGLRRSFPCQAECPTW